MGIPAIHASAHIQKSACPPQNAQAGFCCRTCYLAERVIPWHSPSSGNSRHSSEAQTPVSQRHSGEISARAVLQLVSGSCHTLTLLLLCAPSKISTSHRGLAHTSSLPPMTGDAAADWKRFATSMGRPSPPHASSQSVVRETKSQPPSTAVTPPISPYRPDGKVLADMTHMQLWQKQIQSGPWTRLGTSGVKCP